MTYSCCFGLHEEDMRHVQFPNFVFVTKLHRFPEDLNKERKREKMRLTPLYAKYDIYENVCILLLNSKKRNNFGGKKIVQYAFYNSTFCNSTFCNSTFCNSTFCNSTFCNSTFYNSTFCNSNASPDKMGNIS